MMLTKMGNSFMFTLFIFSVLAFLRGMQATSKHIHILSKTKINVYLCYCLLLLKELGYLANEQAHVAPTRVMLRSVIHNNDVNSGFPPGSRTDGSAS